MEHLTGLVRDLSDRGMTQQASVVTTFMMQMQSLFGGHDDSTMVMYFKEYLRRYRGRAFPERFDMALYAQAIGSGARGGLSVEQKEKLQNAGKLKGKVDELTSKLASMQNEMRQMKTNPTQTGPKKTPFTCNFCGKPGHAKKDCKMNPESDNYDAAFAAREKAKAEKEEEE